MRAGIQDVDFAVEEEQQHDGIDLPQHPPHRPQPRTGQQQNQHDDEGVGARSHQQPGLSGARQSARAETIAT